MLSIYAVCLMVFSIRFCTVIMVRQYFSMVMEKYILGLLVLPGF
uniref:Uncharacterized protein n=1 Tax=mine drainage metagenome TaxID=410659 RepID=E6QLW5_9ZZZZ